ncbi:MAG: hypothetical protein EGR23_11245, partial [Holdemanella biformis]|nr:hypothetical protein [Holdemanella biformis]
RVKLQETLENGRICKVKIYPGAVKTFDICYGEQKRTITIDWAKPIIQGPQEVYPYETHTYWIKGENVKATFSIDSDLAKITETGNDYCKVEIVSGKKGEFVLYCTPEGQEQTELNIKIKSL